jgi:hypothetical protein
MKTQDDNTKTRRRWLVPAVVGGILVLVAIAIALYFLTGTGDDAEPTEAASATPTATPTPSPTPIPEEPAAQFYSAAQFSGWTTSSEADPNTKFSVNGDSVRAGAGALRVDSTTVAVAPHLSLTQSVSVTPGTTYNFSAWVLSPDARPNTAPVVFGMGDDRTQDFEFPSAVEEWTEATWTYTAPAGQTSLPLSIAPGGQMTAFVVDELTMTAAGSTSNILSNGSFDSFTTPTKVVTNQSLVLDTGSATLDIQWFVRSFDWSITAQDGTAVASGNQPSEGGVTHLPFQTIPQGSYDVTFSPEGDPNNATSTTVLIVNPITAEPDVRFGVAGHIDKPAYNHSEHSAAAVGLTSIRTDANWNAIEKTRGQYVMPERYQTSFTDFQNAGLTVLPISNGKNPLYDNDKMPSSPAAIAAFAKSTASIVQHFGTDSVEIYNEPNQPRFNNSACGIQPACYLPLLQASYDAVKAVNPDALIVGPANANQDDPWLTGLYRAGGLNALDVVSYHPYEATPEPLVANLRQATSRIAEYSNGAHKPIWLTEFGWTSNTGAASETMQANYLVRSEAIALANGAERVYWYDLVNDTPDLAAHESNFGLFKEGTSMVPANAPKPAAMAQAVLIRQIGGKPFLADETLNGNAYAFAYGADTNVTRVAWSTSSAQVSYPSDQPLMITTASGREFQAESVNGQVAVTLSEEPVYVTGATGPGTLVG